MTLVKSAPKNSFSQKTILQIKYKTGFCAKLFWVHGFFYTPFELIKESFHLIAGSVCTFYELKRPKLKQPLNILEYGFL
jgi:hypothetical protein